MNRIERLSAILIHLQSKKVVTAAELADRFQISIRTVYRDIRAIEEAGVPLGAEAGKGYFLSDNYSLPPVMFTNDEASAMLIAGKFLDGLPDKTTRNHFSDALYKIKAILKNSQKEHIEALTDQVRVYGPFQNDDARDNKFLGIIQEALVKRCVLEISYYVPSRNETTAREVEPIGLCFYQRDWHLIAWCRLRKEYRDFRLDRIRLLQNTGNNYDPATRLSVDEYFRDWILKADLHEITVEMNHTALFACENSKYWYGFISQSEEKGKTILTFLNPDLKGFARWLLTFGPGIEVIEPVELKEFLHQLIREWCKGIADKK